MHGSRTVKCPKCDLTCYLSDIVPVYKEPQTIQWHGGSYTNPVILETLILPCGHDFGTDEWTLTLRLYGETLLSRNH